MPDEELIEELSEMGGHPCRAHLPMGETLRQAADRLKALKAEVERLASVATDFASSLIVAENNLSHVSEENEWLREGLTYAWSLVEDAQYPDSVQMIRQMRFLSTYFDEDGLRLQPPRAALEKQP
jgi:hypothetical protein